MLTRDFLTQEMKRIAGEIQDANRRKKVEIGKLKAEILQMEKELDPPPSIPLEAFKPIIKEVKQCPQCWADNRIQTPLENDPREPGAATVDFLRCTICHYTCSIEE